ncbi:transmembrane transport protein [Corynebacterium halotolerans YIM 70093 = DSM 44683]|uniref:Transmembrane transport protein n=1 Tax=Corynebacterium halotolerans YIM 70093 = DSM 44683 TaxID=1121362 RepID=M1NS59_9CORY|nr:transmembrane transport protein [Corynebacterium halotolerans YIM 70093 = DSM 44683]
MLGLVGCLFVQTVMAFLIFRDLAGAPDFARYLIPAIVVLGVLTVEVAMVCVWRLLTMVRRGTVFSTSSFRYVDVITDAIAAASVLTFALGAVLAPTTVAPGVVLLLGGLGLLIAGVALVVYVQRALLAQAVDRDARAREMESELDGVI